jgi:hypothetical protein
MLETLLRESDLQKAADGLIQKALDRDGPDNITVVLARFTGAALPVATADDVVTFVPYDPGPGPLPEGASADASSFDHHLASTATVNERVPHELLSDDAVTEGLGDRSGRSGSSAIRTARSVLAFFFLALVAAAAGGIFVMKCEREQAQHTTNDGRSGNP